MIANPIAIKGLVVERAGKRVLEIPHLDVGAGERVAVVGGNGAGKTTLIESLALLTKPTRGVVEIAGAVPSNESMRVEARRRIGFVATAPNLVDATAARNIALPLVFRGVARGERATRVGAAAEMFGVRALLGRPAKTLSAGEAARVSLARAFVARPEILLLDEPFARLDEPTRVDLIRDLGALLPRVDATVVFVTHDRSEAAAIATRVAVLESGRIAQEGAPARLLEHPHTRAAARWAGFENILSGRLLESHAGHERVKIAPGVILDCVGKRPNVDDVAACFRAESVVLAKSADEIHGSIRNRFSTRVVVFSAGTGGMALATLAVGESGPSIVAALTAESAQALGIAVGVEVVAAIKAAAIHVVA